MDGVTLLAPCAGTPQVRSSEGATSAQVPGRAVLLARSLGPRQLMGALSLWRTTGIPRSLFATFIKCMF